MNRTYAASLFALVANDNAPHDPRDYEDFDPAELPPDMFYADDTPMDVCTIMELIG